MKLAVIVLLLSTMACSQAKKSNVVTPTSADTKILSNIEWDKYEAEHCYYGDKDKREACLVKHDCKTIVIPPHMDPERKAAIKVRPVDAATHHCENGKHWEEGHFSTDRFEDTETYKIECKVQSDVNRFDNNYINFQRSWSGTSMAEIMQQQAVESENDRYYWCREDKPGAPVEKW